MSYEVRLIYDDEAVEVPMHSEGGTRRVTFSEDGKTKAIIGSERAELNITFNYTVFFQEHLGKDGIFYLNGKKAEETINMLEKVVSALEGFNPDEDYWKPTAGNVAKTLSTLLEWANLYPYATWNVLS